LLLLFSGILSRNGSFDFTVLIINFQTGSVFRHGNIIRVIFRDRDIGLLNLLKLGRFFSVLLGRDSSFNVRFLVVNRKASSLLSYRKFFLRGNILVHMLRNIIGYNLLVHMLRNIISDNLFRNMHIISNNFFLHMHIISNNFLFRGLLLLLFSGALSRDGDFDFAIHDSGFFKGGGLFGMGFDVVGNNLFLLFLSRFELGLLYERSNYYLLKHRVSFYRVGKNLFFLGFNSLRHIDIVFDDNARLFFLGLFGGGWRFSPLWKIWLCFLDDRCSGFGSHSLRVDFLGFILLGLLLQFAVLFAQADLLLLQDLIALLDNLLSLLVIGLQIEHA